MRITNQDDQLLGPTTGTSLWQVVQSLCNMTGQLAIIQC